MVKGFGIITKIENVGMKKIKEFGITVVTSIWKIFHRCFDSNAMN